ncbi:MAG TPA: MFS transporter [Anaerolineaceae bacterium]|nr:MFS transporter [Anaerolineaceae bacterium]
MEKIKQIKGKTSSVLKTYASRLRAFRWNARMYLVFTIIFGAAMGVRRLIFNFFVLSLGYDEALLGTMITVHNLTALLAALPMGYLADRLGRKLSLISSTVLVALSVVIMVSFPQAWILIVINIVFGLGMSISSVTMGPFLMENSSETERTYLFSFGSGLQMAAGFVGNWIGGYLPGWMGLTFNVDAVSSTAYGNALLATSIFAIVGIVPLIMLRNPNIKLSERSSLAPMSYLKDHFGQITKLVLPMLITSIGAGLIMPFMNIFFRNVHNQPDPAIGTVFAWGSLAMGVGLIVAPVLADRFGKIQVVVMTQGLSIPFLFILGFSPWFALSAGAYFVRLALMNMSGPVYQTFVMEQVEPQARATIASLISMASSFGWAFSPSISGWIQVNYGFRPAFVGTMVLYAISIFLYWFFFLRGKESIFKQREAHELLSS